MTTSALIEFIKNNHLEYYGKIVELRGEIEEWLAYIPNTFPHYTRHTIKHSDTIINQISNLLFENDDPSKPLIRLSGIEAYILVAAAYLHDAGMVTSDKEKAEILESDSWKKWASGEGGGAKRWNEIKALRKDETLVETDSATRNFLADIQTRFLIAEFIRGQHHLRAATVIELHHDKLGRIDFGDHMLRDAIAQVCVGHGLRQHELEDNERFPDLRDIRGEKVNLRFLAILLRLGDLLDMSVDRACPLLLNAASPLPSDSLAHWSQYNAIRHRVTSPESIEITAECANQEEDRVLRDWCQWIVDEVRNAKIIIPKGRRHNNWQIPNASIEGDTPTIKIRPAKNASYIPSNWILDFDKQAIFNILSNDLYGNPMVFLRELIQNALDAIRCKIYIDLENEGKETPDYPTQVSENFRARYNVRLSISEKEIPNKLSGENEKKLVVVIEDDGIGMDYNIIEKYFLQIGRSFYNSDEYRRKFHFMPTSRFGIGFLSVFAVSDYITVDTYKPSSETPNNKPVKIILTGLRNYILKEKSNLEKSGTRIEIVLREDIEEGKLTELVSDWCKRVEFSIIVNDFGKETIITSEGFEDFVFEQPHITKPNTKFVLKAFPIEHSGIEGEIYVLMLTDENEEYWDVTENDINSYLKSHPASVIPDIVKSQDFLHGIEFGYSYSSNEFIYRFDIRSRKYLPNLSRSQVRLEEDIEDSILEVVESEYEKLISKHLNQVSFGVKQEFWKYKQSLANKFSIENYWDSVPETIPIYINNSSKLISLNEFLEFGEFYMYRERDCNCPAEDIMKFISTIKRDLPIIFDKDLKLFSKYFLNKILYKDYDLNKFDIQSHKFSRLHWIKKKGDGKCINVNEYSKDICYVVNFGNKDLLSFNFYFWVANSFHIEFNLLNKQHPLGKWLSKIQNDLENQDCPINKIHFYQIINNIFEIKSYNFEEKKEKLSNYLNNLSSIENIPKKLRPPKIVFTEEMFD